MRHVLLWTGDGELKAAVSVGQGHIPVAPVSTRKNYCYIFRTEHKNMSYQTFPNIYFFLNSKRIESRDNLVTFNRM